MSPRRPYPRRGLLGQRGFTLVEVVVGTALLGLAATVVLGGLLYGMTEARRGKQRAEAAAWVQAELDYLRLRGYSFDPDLDVGNTRTLTQTDGYTTYGDITEPRIPPGFERAEIRADDHTTLPLRRLTVILYESVNSRPYVILSTYVAHFTHALPP